jgi:hypothetical protein
MCQKLLDYFYYSRKYALDWITYFSIRFYGIEDRTFEEIINQTSNKAKYEDLVLDDKADVDLLLSIAKDSHKVANERRAVVTDKCKTLQALSAFLLTIIGVFLPKAFDFDSTCMRVIFYIAVLFLLNAVTLLLIYFAVGVEAIITVDQQKAKTDKDELKKWLINQYGRCTTATDNRTDYLVDIYKVSRFFFLFAFTLIILLFSISYFTRTSTTDIDKTIIQLRSDPKLIELLRGPKGETGSRGEKGDVGGKGDQGEHGEKGEKGDKGDNASPNDKNRKPSSATLPNVSGQSGPLLPPRHITEKGFTLV